MPCHAVMLLCPLAAAAGTPNAAAADSCVALLQVLLRVLLLLLPTLRLVGDASRAVAGRLRPRCDAPLEEPLPPTLRLVTGLALLLPLVLLFVMLPTTLPLLLLILVLLLLPLLVLLRAARDSALRSCGASRNGFLAKQKPLGSDAVTGSMSSK
jgi:hypothetical protein